MFLTGKRVYFHFALRGCLTACVFALLLRFPLPANSKIIDKCELASQLDDSDIDTDLVDQLVCLAEELSNRNCSAIKKQTSYFHGNQSIDCQQYTLGIFQISNDWCNTPDDKEFGTCMRNGYQKDQVVLIELDLLDDDITDDIKCIKSIHKLEGLDIWPQIAVNDCRRAALTSKPGWNITECLNNERHRKRKLTSIPLWAALLIVAISSLTVFLLTYFFYRYRRNNVSILSPSEIKQFKYGRISSMRPQLPTPRLSEYVEENFANEPYNNDFEMAPTEYVIDYSKCLGAGAYGIVYKAMCKGKLVAAKTVKQDATKEYLQSLLGEIKILCHIGRHDFIVNLEGAHTKNLHKGNLYVFMEYCPLGNLEKFLRTNRSNYLYLEEIKGKNENSDSDDNEDKYGKSPLEARTLTFKHLLQYAHQIAKGMEFLASKKVIHGDLAARNILLVNAKLTKISDFGLSRKMYGYIHYIKKKEEPLPWRWMAIESLRENDFSTFSDVWMYGVLLFEIFSLGQVPYTGLSWTLDFVEKLETGFRLMKPTYAPANIYEDMMKKCWETNSTQRPSFSDLSNYFHHALRKITAKDYTELVMEDKDIFPTKKEEE